VKVDRSYCPARNCSCFPRVGETLGVQLWVAEHFLQGGVIKGRVSGGVESVLTGEGGLVNRGGSDGAQSGGGGATWSGWEGWRGVTSCREVP